ncbi:MAG: hypothetical protein M1826_000562 [Phylliscum demangeonii]|nr:MAG: hypothetical protein M1826_000562 [Phylliscum demangeonii]
MSKQAYQKELLAVELKYLDCIIQRLQDPHIIGDPQYGFWPHIESHCARWASLTSILQPPNPYSRNPSYVDIHQMGDRRLDCEPESVREPTLAEVQARREKVQAERDTTEGFSLLRSERQTGVMASFVFRWPHPATEVFVTGTFDDWAKSVRLEKRGDAFEQRVHLPDAHHNVYYKFVVDGIWTTDHTAPQARDGQNNLNNVLTPQRMENSSFARTPIAAAFMSSAAPHASTADLARAVPLESREMDVSSQIPGGYPLTPSDEMPAFIPIMAVNPSSGAGLDGQRAINESTSTAPASEPAPTLRVNPLPATAGSGNPIQLQPGETVPDPAQFTTNTIHSNVTVDRESYDRAGSAAAALPSLPPVVTPQVERDRRGTGWLDLPPITKGMIPESSLPMGGAAPADRDPGIFLSSAAPTSTTAALAAHVSREPRPGPEPGPPTPDDSDAPAYADAVQEMHAPKEELASERRVAPPSSEGMGIASHVAGTHHTNGPGVPDRVRQSQSAAHVDPEASAVPEAVYEKEEVEEELLAEVKRAAPASEGLGTGGLATAPGRHLETAKVPERVQESQRAAHVDPEASAVAEAVREKHAVEEELTREIPPFPAASQGVGFGSRTSPATTDEVANSRVPAVVRESQRQAHVDPEASAVAEAVQEKHAVEDELTREIPPFPAASQGVGSGSRTSPATTSDEANSRVPVVVRESQRQAHVDPEASAVSEAVQEKHAVEDELTREIPPIPAVSQGVGTAGNFRPESSSPDSDAQVPTVVRDSQRRAHVDPEASAVSEAVQEKHAVEEELTRVIPVVPAVVPGVGTQGHVRPVDGRDDPDARVPEVVRHSQQEAHVDPEASAVPEAVQEKRAVEDELVKEIHPMPPAAEGAGLRGDPASEPYPETVRRSHAAPMGSRDRDEAVQSSTEPGFGAVAEIATPPGPSKIGQETSSEVPRALPATVMQSIQEMNSGAYQPMAPDVPAVVARSIDQAHASPEAASNEEAVLEKRAVEQELVNEGAAPYHPGHSASPATGTTSDVAPPSTSVPVSAPRRVTQPTAADSPPTMFSGAQPQAPTLAAAASSPAVTPINQAAAVSAPVAAVAGGNLPSSVTAFTPALVVTTGAEASPSDTRTPKKTVMAASPAATAAATAAAAAASSASSTPQSASSPLAGDSPSSGTSKKDRRRSGFFGKLKEKLRKN